MTFLAEGARQGSHQGQELVGQNIGFALEMRGVPKAERDKAGSPPQSRQRRTQLLGY